MRLQSSLHQSCNTGSSGPAGAEPEPHSSKQSIDSLILPLLFSSLLSSSSLCFAAIQVKAMSKEAEGMSETRVSLKAMNYNPDLEE